jgi:hypothetical protein
MSEDIDLKITAEPAPTKAELRKLRTDLSQALAAAGFVFDPESEDHVVSRNNTKYTLYRLPYQPTAAGQGALRPEIQIETALWPVRLPTVEREVKSFYAEAFQLDSEVENIACVCVQETAAEKFVALTRRVAAEQGKPPEQRDKTLVRHIYDLHVIRAHYEFAEVIPLIPAIMQADAEAYGNQYPPYRDDPHGETWKAIHALENDPHYATVYAELNRDMVYGEKVSHADGVALLKQMATEAIPKPTPAPADDQESQDA